MNTKPKVDCGLRAAERLRVELRFIDNETIMGCFQIGRTFEWARAHFFVGPRTMALGAALAGGDKAMAVSKRTRMDLAKIREAAERVARSEGLEIFDVEWKIGKQRLLRVYLDRLPGPENPEGLGVSS